MSKPLGPCFDGTYRAKSRVRKGTIAECAPFFKSHYLGRRPGVVPLVLVIEVASRPVGMVCFGIPPRETDRRYGRRTWELARLWIADDVPTNAETWAIAAAIRYVRKNHPEVGMLVSYADPSFGHQGTIYKASNWRADGRTDGERKSPRCDYLSVTVDMFGERVKKCSRRAHADGEIRKVPRSSKFRFVYPLSPESEKEPRS